jgi:ketosteroid isomerase-like protein
MSEHKTVVERYMEGFRRSDHEMVLSCLTEDVVWDLPGAFHLVGKAAFDREIENPAFKGKPTIHVSRLVEEGDVVVAEGTVRAEFCDVFEMQDGKIRRLISYLIPVE